MPNERAGAAEALHRRIAEDLESAVDRGELLPNGKLPSELDLARKYGVSRGTVSKALDTLVRRGVLFRRCPVGTFVAPTPEGLRLSGDDSAGRKRRPVIGLIVPYLLDSFSGSIVLGVENVTRSAGYELGFAHSENDRGIERYHIDNFLQGGATGLVIIPADPDVRIVGQELAPGVDAERMRVFEDLQRNGVPFALVDRYLPGLNCD
jgi:DNA-binding transcriptional regulator YhcF (GntR family)